MLSLLQINFRGLVYAFAIVKNQYRGFAVLLTDREDITGKWIVLDDLLTTENSSELLGLEVISLHDELRLRLDLVLHRNTRHFQMLAKNNFFRKHFPRDDLVGTGSCHVNRD